MKSDAHTRTSLVAKLEAGVRPWLNPWNAEHAAGRNIRLCVPKIPSALIGGGNRLTLAHHDRISLPHLVSLDGPVQVEKPA